MRDFIKYTEAEIMGHGGKANGLVSMVKMGLMVPPFYIIPNSTIQKIISGELCPVALFKKWMEEISPDKKSLWALRSSAEVEDGKEKSFAGIFSTEINCYPDSLVNAFNNVLKGFEKSKSSGYYQNHTFGFNVLLQEMIAGEISGVGFSVDPLDITSQNPIINIIPGLGFRLVSGEENAMIIDLEEKEYTIVSSEDNYKGQIYDSGYFDISYSKEKLFELIKPHLSEIRSTLINLEKKLGYPVDTEFTICKNKLYWLQVRPVTNIHNRENFRVWDNSNVANNYPGVVMPLTSSFVLHSYSNAYIQMFRFLGAGERFIKINYELFKNMSGTIQGAMYYNLTAWQQLLYQMPFGKKTSRMITKSFGAEKANFSLPANKSAGFAYFRLFSNLIRSMMFFNFYKSKYLKQYEKAKAKIEKHSLENKSHEQLIQIYKELEEELGKYWYPPMINGFYTMVSYNFLTKIFARSTINDSHPNFLNDALTGSGDVISVKIVRTLQNLLFELHHNEKVKKMILQEDSTKALLMIKTDFPEIYSLINNYLVNFGERCDDGELKLETVNYKEDPAKFIGFLKTNLSVEYHAPVTNNSYDYRKVLKEAYRTKPIRLFFLWTTLKFTIDRVRDRENFRFIRTKTFGFVRVIFRAMDYQLLQSGKIKHRGDSLYLRFEEVMKPELVNNYAEIIEKRKVEYENYKRITHPVRFHETGGEFIPVQEKFNFGNELKGTGCSSGLVEGEIILVNSQNIHKIDVKDKILVSEYFEPGWIGLFARARGLISERGSLLSHTSILCREMGVPAIVGAKNILHQLTEGERIKMNGATGKIERITVHE